MTPRQIQLCALALEKADPAAELVARIIDAGITETELAEALRGVVLGEPFRNELELKFRDLTIVGSTFNRYGKRWKRPK
jgi:hypothetical protein